MRGDGVRAQSSRQRRRSPLRRSASCCHDDARRTAGLRGQVPGQGRLRLAARGRSVDRSKGLETWINARMTHVFGLATVMGREDARSLAEHGIAALYGLLHDRDHGAGSAAREQTATRLRTTTPSSCSRGRLPRFAGLGDQLLTDALELWDTRFWDDETGTAGRARRGGSPGRRSAGSAHRRGRRRRPARAARRWACERAARARRGRRATRRPEVAQRPRGLRSSR